MLEALTTPRHIILATVLAIGVALPVVYATEVTADSKVAITDVERKITAIDKVVKRHTYELGTRPRVRQAMPLVFSIA